MKKIIPIALSFSICALGDVAHADELVLCSLDNIQGADNVSQQYSEAGYTHFSFHGVEMSLHQVDYETGIIEKSCKMSASDFGSKVSIMQAWAAYEDDERGKILISIPHEQISQGQVNPSFFKANPKRFPKTP